MLVKTEYNIGEHVIVRASDGNDYRCKITDITIYLHNNSKKNYVSYLCVDIKTFKNYSVTKSQITNRIKLYRVRKWLSKVFYKLYLKYDELW